MDKSKKRQPLVLPEHGEVWERRDLSLYTRERAYIHRRGVLTREDEWVFFAHDPDSKVATHMLPIADFLQFFFRVAQALTPMLPPAPAQAAAAAMH